VFCRRIARPDSSDQIETRLIDLINEQQFAEQLSPALRESNEHKGERVPLVRRAGADDNCRS
jgi:hypothetical protein